MSTENVQSTDLSLTAVRLSEAQRIWLRDEQMLGSTEVDYPALWESLQEEHKALQGARVLDDLYWLITSVINRASYGDNDASACRDKGFGQRIMAKLLKAGGWESPRKAQASLYMAVQALDHSQRDLSCCEKSVLLEAIPSLRRFTVEEAHEVISNAHTEEVSIQAVETYLAQLVEMEIIQAIGTRSSWEDGELCHYKIYCQYGRAVEMTEDILGDQCPEYEDYEVPAQDASPEIDTLQDKLLAEYEKAISSQYYVSHCMKTGSWTRSIGEQTVTALAERASEIREELLLNHGDIMTILEERGMLDEWSEVAYDEWVSAMAQIREQS